MKLICKLNNGAQSVDIYRIPYGYTRFLCAYLSFLLQSRTYNTFAPFSLRRFTPTQDTLLLRSSRPRLILLVRGRGTEYLRDTETDSLQLYWPPPLFHLLLPPSLLRLLLVGLSELSVLPLLRLPTSQRHYSLP